MKSKSQFEKWFKAQFGGMYNMDKNIKLYRERDNLLNELAKVENQIKKNKLLLDLFNAIMYSKKAAENGYKF